MSHILYECEICSGLHPWEFDGDCRYDPQRFHDVEDYAERLMVKPDEVEVRSMEERVNADTE